jgi:hypothetical protein
MSDPNRPRSQGAEPAEGLAWRRFLGASRAPGAGPALEGLAGGSTAHAAPSNTAGSSASTSARPVPPGDIVSLDALELSRAIKRRQVSCTEVMHAYLDHIERVTPHVNATVGLRDPEVSPAPARERDRQPRRGEKLFHILFPQVTAA